jgi:hypothetical protein
VRAPCTVRFDLPRDQWLLDFGVRGPPRRRGGPASASSGGSNRIHTVLGEGDFVLVVSEGSIAGQPTAFYDLIPIDIRCM